MGLHGRRCHTRKEGTLQTNNSLREALSDACYAMFNFLKAQNGGYEEMANALDKAKAALAKPLRNCDVGTAEAQLFRHKKYCKWHTTNGGCSQCPLVNSLDCRFVWAQMPYEKGETDGSK